MTRTSDLTPPGSSSLARVRGYKGKAAGTPGQTHLDAGGNDVIAPETQYIGATVSGEDGERAVVTINGTGQQSVNASGQALEYGDVVVLQSDGTLALTTTAQDTRSIGVVQIGGPDGDPVHVIFSGYVAQVNTTGDVVAGDYLETSTTAGAAQANATQRTGSFAVAMADGPNPPARLLGSTTTTAAPGSETPDDGGFLTKEDADSLYLTRATGMRAALAINSDTGSTETLDLAAGNHFDLTLTANTTLTFTNPPPAGVEGRWTVVARQDDTGGWEITWPASVVWRDTDGTQTATPPALSTAATAIDVIVVTTLDGGVSFGASLENGSNGAAGASFATPAIVLGTAAAAGAASTTIRSDATIVAFDATVPVTQAFGDSAATGSAAVAARRDHRHGMPSASGGTFPKLLLASDHATPFTFDDILQASDGSDFLYASE